MIKMLQRRFALSRQGAADLIKGCIACVVQDISFMLPVGLLYYFVIDIMNGKTDGNRMIFYVAGAVLYLVLIFAATWFQYNATYLATYVESGVRRITLAEQLRKIPLSFFGKKDLADLTNSIMGDCATLETAFSHYVPAWRDPSFLRRLSLSAFSRLTGGWLSPQSGFCRLRLQSRFFLRAYRSISTVNPWRQMWRLKMAYRSASKVYRI